MNPKASCCRHKEEHVTGFQSHDVLEMAEPSYSEMPGIRVGGREVEGGLVTYTGKGHELIRRGLGNVLKPDFGGTYMGVYNCQKSLNCTLLNGCILSYVKYTLVKLTGVSLQMVLNFSFWSFCIF